MAVLEALAADGVEGMSVAELSRRLGMNRSTCTAIVTTLAEAGFLDRRADRSYTLGAGLVPIANAVRTRLPVIADAESELWALSRELGAGCTLTHASDEHLVVIARCGSAGQLPPGTEVGSRFPLVPPYGAVIMAFRPPGVAEQWIAASPPDSEQPERLREILHGIRARGFGVWRLEPFSSAVLQQIGDIVAALAEDVTSRSLRDQLTVLLAAFGGRAYIAEELVPGVSLPVSYLVAPVFDTSGVARYEIELHLLRPDVRSEEIARLGARLRGVADAITDRIGGVPPRER